MPQSERSRNCSSVSRAAKRGGNANVNMKQGGAKIADGRQTGLRNFFLQIPIGTPRDSIPKSNLGSDRR